MTDGLNRLRAGMDEAVAIASRSKVALCLALERAAVNARLERASRLLEVTRKMRDSQRLYFRTRDQAALREAQRLERDLDRLIAPQPSLPGLEEP